jgi:hypothetical protein
VVEVAEDRWPRWAAEQAGTARGPSVGRLLVALAMVAALLLGLAGRPAVTAEGGQVRRPPTLCQEHAGRPGWDAVCADTGRR